MKCICIFKSKNSFEKINQKYQEFIDFDYVNTLDDSRGLLVNKNYDFAILDYNSYCYHEVLEILNTKEIEVIVFNGIFSEIEIELEKYIEKEKSYRKDNEEKVRIVERTVEVEKKIEVEVEKTVEKLKYKKVVISVIAGKKGIGSTHYSLCIARYLKNYRDDFTVAVVEIGENKLKNNLKNSDIDIFHFKDISEYYISSDIRKYDYVILDLGFYKRDYFNELFLSSELKVSIFGAKKWEMPVMQTFLRDMTTLRVIKELNFIFNFAFDDEYKEIKDDMGELKIYKGVYCLDYRHLNNEISDMIFSMLNPFLNIDKSENGNIVNTKKSIFNIFKKKVGA